MAGLASDPDFMAAMADPELRGILQGAMTNPMSMMAHMGNPKVSPTFPSPPAHPRLINSIIPAHTHTHTRARGGTSHDYVKKTKVASLMGKIMGNLGKGK